MEWLIFAGIGIVLLLRANANASAANGNPAYQNVTAAASTFVPFAHAANAATPQAGGVSNPRAVNGNGQPLVSAPSAAAINIGSQDAVISGNYEASNTSSLNANPLFTFTDPSTGATCQCPTYWRWAWDGFRQPINYSGPAVMQNWGAPGPQEPASDGDMASIGDTGRFLQCDPGQVTW